MQIQNTFMIYLLTDQMQMFIMFGNDEYRTQ